MNDFEKFEQEMKEIKERATIVQERTFVKITQDNINKILEALKINGVLTSSVLDIGCGSGYWITTIKSYYPDISIQGIRLKQYAQDNKKLSKYIIEQDFKEFPTKDNFETWLLFWPNYDSTFATEVLQEFLENTVKRLIYIGEDWGGCTADDSFFELLETIENDPQYEIEDIEIDQYPGIHDFMKIITKK